MKRSNGERLILSMGALCLVLVLFATGYAYAACFAFYKGEYTEGLNKICLYDYVGSPYAITLKSYQVCPVQIEVPCS